MIFSTQKDAQLYFNWKNANEGKSKLYFEFAEVWANQMEFLMNFCGKSLDGVVDNAFDVACKKHNVIKNEEVDFRHEANTILGYHWIHGDLLNKIYNKRIANGTWK